ncbi:GDSL-type esterase/lipase family protein [Corynebacterium heidelbergense]|uniref:Esterase n=1 Tax=Corynebacterium heidelbergense TaxID=2055947 RepID=A0A364VCU5_9CORY|nr:GDSL-type esterase/lipase family protein [Corynebacterium heidelbergense]RAV34451.1 esterase [Corynebacterium heidelbergense]WCZ37556.1 Lipase 2 precursor [Corynebacterium heidelbergense]
MRNKLGGIAAAVIAGCGMFTAAPAQAAPGGNVVYAGDSFTANPDFWRVLANGVSPDVARQGTPTTEGCLQTPDNAPRLLAQKTGLAVADWSCAGQTSRSMLGRLDRSVQTGDLNPNTRAVVLAVGINNYGPAGVAEGTNILDPGAVKNGMIGDMKAAAEKIRGVAPNAKILVQGQLSVSDPASAMYCSVNVVPNLPGGFPIPLLRDIENFSRDAQRTAAREIGARFVEIKDPSAGHSSCAPDQERWVAGVVDTTTPDYHMMFHPSRAGSEFVAGEVAKSV